MDLESIEDVKEFWNSNPCQSNLSTEEDRREYFRDISRKRFQGREWHVPIIAKFDWFRGKRVLEVGCGIGTDGFEFARSGAEYHAIDLTPSAIAISSERFRLFDLPGTFTVANAEEEIPYPENFFDHIYSFGVIHHSPNTEAIVAEMHRVLKPGGTCTIMLYNRTSINYYVEIMFFRKLFRFMLFPSFMPRLLARITGFDREKLEGHRSLLLERPRMTKQEWISVNTDGPSCPLAKVYGKKEAAELFEAFSEARQEVWEFNTQHWSFLGRCIPQKIARNLGRRWGWHRLIYAVK